jgi:thiosulfate/3-mercaptopyruvate sulfurtransferase
LTDLGISKDKHIVIYDDKNGSNASARFWWMLKSVGHEKVQVLNGGLNQAKIKNFPMSSEIECAQALSEPYQIKKWNPQLSKSIIKRRKNKILLLILCNPQLKSPKRHLIWVRNRRISLKKN